MSWSYRSKWAITLKICSRRLRSIARNLKMRHFMKCVIRAPTTYLWGYCHQNLAVWHYVYQPETSEMLKRTMGVVNVYKTHLFKFGLKFTWHKFSHEFSELGKNRLPSYTQLEGYICPTRIRSGHQTIIGYSSCNRESIHEICWGRKVLTN